MRVRVRPPDGRTPPAPAETPEPPVDPAPPSEPPSLANAPRFSVPMPGAALLAAAFAMAITSRGHVLLLALLLGFGVTRRVTGLAAGLALTAALVRWGSPSLGAIAGAQAVLGPAGWTGSGAAVASAWFASAALLLAAVPLVRTNSAATAASLSPFALAAADVVVGPAPGGALALRAVASIVALVVTVVLTRWRPRPSPAIVCGALALLCAGVAR